MSFNKNDIIEYRIKKSDITFEEAEYLSKEGYWNGSLNRLYYSCFHLVSALLIKNDIAPITHNGVKTEFFRLYIKTGKIDNKYSKLYSNLMNLRHESDYEEFHFFSQEEVEPIIDEVREFLVEIRKYI